MEKFCWEGGRRIDIKEHVRRKKKGSKFFENKLMVGVEAAHEVLLVLADMDLLEDVLSSFLGDFLSLPGGALLLGLSLLEGGSLLGGHQTADNLLSAKGLGIRVQLDHEAKVSQGILLAGMVLSLLLFAAQV